MIESRIKEGCNQIFHFVVDLESELEVAKIITAFSNSTGGDLIIGVRNNGKIVGVSPTDIIEKANRIIDLYIEKRINTQISSVVIGRHIVVQLIIPSSEFKTKVKEGIETNYYIRINSSTFPINKIIKSAWAMDISTIRESEVLNEVYDLFHLKKQISLAYIYKECLSKNNKLDLAVSQLLATKKIELVELDGEIRYQLDSGPK